METTARGDKPKTLQTIAYISIPESVDLKFLLWDLQDAIAAYAQLSGTALPRPVDLGVDDAGHVADGIVLAVDDAFDDEAMTAVEQILDRLGNTEARVYVVVLAGSEDAERAHETAVRLRRACRLRDLSWCGGVVICAGSGIEALRRSPRMGLLRRPFSEAMDKLAGAVRMGCSVEHAQKLGGAATGGADTDGMVRTEPALPTPIWHAVMRRLAKHSNC